MRHHYKGPRPLTIERYKTWLRGELDSGRIGLVLKHGTAYDGAKRPVPWIEDDQPEPGDPPRPALPIN